MRFWMRACQKTSTAEWPVKTWPDSIKNIVATGLADECEIQVAYAIGVAKPQSINVDTYGTGRVDENGIQGILEDRALFDFRPAAIIEQLKLLNPQGWSYAQTAAYGHFGRNCFPWGKTDKANILKQVFKNIKAA
jgi:S-adenosylmethionine synthetase